VTGQWRYHFQINNMTVTCEVTVMCEQILCLHSSDFFVILSPIENQREVGNLLQVLIGEKSGLFTCTRKELRTHGSEKIQFIFKEKILFEQFIDWTKNILDCCFDRFHRRHRSRPY
jgi:hypothetical protein